MGNAPLVLPTLVGNPLLAERERLGSLDRSHPERQRLVRRYAYGAPTPSAIEAVADASPAGVVEIGAGTGYWARLLHDRGVDVVAYDAAPPEAGANQHVDAAAPWFPVRFADGRVAAEHPERTLLVVWPTWRDTWAADAVAAFHAAGGQTVVYVGEGPGGVTGDATLHARLGIHGPCLPCRLGVPDAPCVCAIDNLYSLALELKLPRRADTTDTCGVYVRVAQRPSRWRLRPARGGRSR